MNHIGSIQSKLCKLSIKLVANLFCSTRSTQPVVSAGWMSGSGEGSSLEILPASRYNNDVFDGDSDEEVII